MEHDKVPILEGRSSQEIEIPIISEKLEVVHKTMESYCNSVCAFSKQENSVAASEESSKSAKKLCGLIVFYAIVMLVEIVGGIKANSLAVISDAAHLLSDIAGFLISLFAVWASGWEATLDQSFGYNRLEVLGAFLSLQLIWFISGYLIYEAVGRILLRNSEVNGMLMFGIAAFGFVLNFIMVVWLGHDHHHHHGFGVSDHNHSHHHHHHGHGDSDNDHGHHHGHGDSDKDHGHHHCSEHSNHDHVKEELTKINDEEKLELLSSDHSNSNVFNINLQGAYLHVMVDMIQSVGVMIAGAIIWAKPEWLVVDLMCTLIFSVISLSTTVPMLKNIYGILMERTPSEINIINLEDGLKSIKGVQDIHDLHVWSITVGKNVLSCHILAESGISSVDLLGKIKDYCKRTHKIEHVTIQIE
ncbi:putative cation efflux protein [Lupinus albus]|uniref:Putative cation efflux protein n=1 Tax=Lupinus albus TaxID=3870 RepID=A0A6A4R4K4_LUPAL|nr:putative cation efflux protein [Lupinus albus]